MFGIRSDGVELKTMPAEFKLMPMLMKERSDSQVFFNQDVPIAAIEEYISKKNEEGIRITLIDVVFAGIVRILGQRPALNRFAKNGRAYQRNGITICMSIKKSLTDEGEETTIKVPFTGKENLFEVKEKLQKMIAENKSQETENGTDKTADLLSKIPTGILKTVVKYLIHLDNKGRLPKKIIEISPFHTSAFVTNVGSLGIDSIYHHIYNFGTTSLFFAVGKKKKSYVFEDDEIVKEKCVNLPFVGDERICDGYYYAHSFKMLTRYLKHPELLEKTLDEELAEKQKEKEETIV